MAESNYLPEAMLQVAGFLASFAVIALLFTMMFTPAVRGHATVPPSIERRKFLATLGGAAAWPWLLAHDLIPGGIRKASAYTSLRRPSGRH
jgi:hypothetical protein